MSWVSALWRKLRHSAPVSAELYIGIWDVADEPDRLAQFVARYASEFRAMCAQDGVRLVGQVRWRLRRGRLVAYAPAVEVAPPPTCLEVWRAAEALSAQHRA